MHIHSTFHPNFNLHLQRDMVLFNISRMMTSVNRKESIEKICKDFEIDILYAFGSRSVILESYPRQRLNF